MKESKPDTIRNVAVLSYGGAGKTTLIEAILCSSGTIPQMGSVVAGTTAMDYDPEEHHRKVSIQTSLCQISWNDTARIVQEIERGVVPGNLAEAGLDGHRAQSPGQSGRAQLSSRSETGGARGGWRSVGLQCRGGGQ